MISSSNCINVETFQSGEQDVVGSPSGTSRNNVININDVPECENEDDGNEKTPTFVSKGKGNRCSWSKPQDILLISGWVNFSPNPKIGTNQTMEAFWGR